MSNFDVTSGALLLAGQNGASASLIRTDKNNFAPRVGLAYQIDSKTVVRAGGGVFYNSTFMQELQDKRKFYPYNTAQFFSAPTIDRLLRPTRRRCAGVRPRLRYSLASSSMRSLRSPSA
jgi:hypothetical protein